MTNLQLDLLSKIFDLVLTALRPPFSSFAAINTQLDIDGSHFLELHFLFQKRFFIFGALGSASPPVLLAVVR